MTPEWRRAAGIFGQNPWEGLRRSWRYAQAEVLRRAMKWRGRTGPARLEANRGQPIRPDQVERILFVKLWGMGDMIMATPALQMLKARFPRAEFMLLGSTAAGQVLAGVEGVFVRQALIPGAALTASSPLPYRALAEARAFQPDLGFLSTPLNHWRTAEAADRLGARWVVGADESGIPAGITARVPVRPEMHMVERNVALARAVGCEGDPPPMNLWLREDERRAARDWLARNAPGRPRVVLHLGSTPEFFQKVWPREYFSELGRRLSARGIRVILLEGPDEREAVRKTAAEIAPAPAVAGPELSLRQTFALLAETDLVIAGSSVFVHAAAAVGTTALAIAGPTPPAYRPWSERGAEVVSPADCAPCHQPGRPLVCRDPRCMREISVEMVVAAAEGMLFAAKGNAV